MVHVRLEVPPVRTTWLIIFDDKGLRKNPLGIWRLDSLIQGRNCGENSFATGLLVSAKKRLLNRTHFRVDVLPGHSGADCKATRAMNEQQIQY